MEESDQGTSEATKKKTQVSHLIFHVVCLLLLLSLFLPPSSSLLSVVVCLFVCLFYLQNDYTSFQLPVLFIGTCMHQLLHDRIHKIFSHSTTISFEIFRQLKYEPKKNWYAHHAHMYGDAWVCTRASGTFWCILIRKSKAVSNTFTSETSKEISHRDSNPTRGNSITSSWFVSLPIRLFT